MKGTVTITGRKGALVSGEYEVSGDRLRVIYDGQERLVRRLKELYESLGYTRFSMRRFEEYALYLENKSFLKSESVLNARRNVWNYSN